MTTTQDILDTIAANKAIIDLAKKKIETCERELERRFREQFPSTFTTVRDRGHQPTGYQSVRFTPDTVEFTGVLSNEKLGFRLEGPVLRKDGTNSDTRRAYEFISTEL